MNYSRMFLVRRDYPFDCLDILPRRGWLLRWRGFGIVLYLLRRGVYFGKDVRILVAIEGMELEVLGGRRRRGVLWLR